jgi:hypothetical protein
MILFFLKLKLDFYQVDYIIRSEINFKLIFFKLNLDREPRRPDPGVRTEF